MQAGKVGSIAKCVGVLVATSRTAQCWQACLGPATRSNQGPMLAARGLSHAEQVESCKEHVIQLRWHAGIVS